MLLRLWYGEVLENRWVHEVNGLGGVAEANAHHEAIEHVDRLCGHLGEASRFLVQEIEADFNRRLAE